MNDIVGPSPAASNDQLASLVVELDQRLEALKSTDPDSHRELLGEMQKQLAELNNAIDLAAAL